MMNVKFACFILVCSFVFFSCKNGRDQFDGDSYSSIDCGIALSEISNIRNLIDYEVRKDSAIFKTAATPGTYCPGSVITVISTGINQGTMEINFGGGVVCADSRNRSGKLNVTYSGKWRNTGSSLEITPQGYTVDAFACLFTKLELLNNGINLSNQSTWSALTTGASFIRTEGNILLAGQQTVSWIEGENTPTNPDDNVFSLQGSGTGKTRFGLSFTWTITDPLIVQSNCKYIEGGSVEIIPNGYELRTVNFGPGKGYCDNFITLSIGTFAMQLEMP